MYLSDLSRGDGTTLRASSFNDNPDSSNNSMFNLCKTTAAMETVSLGAISCWGQSALSAATQSPWIHQGSNTWQYTPDHSRIYNHMLHRSAHILSAHRHLF